MGDSLVIFESIIALNNMKNVYVTDSALGYFYEIRNVLDFIAIDIAENETGTTLFMPGEGKAYELFRKIKNNINEMEKFLENNNKDSIEHNDRVVNIRNILVRFHFIKKLMMCSEKLRSRGFSLFTIAANCYSNEEIYEFVNLLEVNELESIKRLIVAEETLIEKKLSHTPILNYVESRLDIIKEKSTYQKRKKY